MQTSIMSYSFRRSFESGAMDIGSYLTFSKEHGFTHYAPWNMHLMAGFKDDAYIDQVKTMAEAAGLKCGCVAVDRGHIYEKDAEARTQLRGNAKRWIDIARCLGAIQVRIDAGGPEEMPDDAFQVIVDGFLDLIGYGRERGIEIVTENHWGPTKFPDNVVKLLETVHGLGLLFDTTNWAEGHIEEGWQKCARYAKAVHIKGLTSDASVPKVDLPKCIATLKAAGYNSVWGIESAPIDGDEQKGVLQTLALIKRELGGQ